MLMLTLFAACDDWIYDDLSECKMYIQFSYDYNMLGTDAFAQQVEEVTVFFFDQDGHFVKAQSESGDALKTENYKMEVQLPYGRNYTAIAWAGHLDSYDVATLKVGQSTPQDLTLKLEKYDASALVCKEEIDNLWHGASIEFYRVEGSQTENIRLVKNTNRIRFILRDVNSEEATAEPISDFSVGMTAANTDYDYTHSVMPTSQLMTYAPYYTAGDSFESMVAELNTMRIMSDMDCRLTIKNRVTGKSIFGEKNPDMDLTKLLLLTKMESYKMSDQEYLDREYDWKIAIFYTSSTEHGSLQYMATRIMINDWTVWVQNEEL